MQNRAYVGIDDLFRSLAEVLQRAENERLDGFSEPVATLSYRAISGSLIESARLVSFDQRRKTVTVDIGAVCTIPVEAIEHYTVSIGFRSLKLPEPMPVAPVRMIAL